MNTKIFFQVKDMRQGWNCTGVLNRKHSLFDVHWTIISLAVILLQVYEWINRQTKLCSSGNIYLGGTVKYLLLQVKVLSEDNMSVVWQRGPGFGIATDLRWGHYFTKALGPE